MKEVARDKKQRIESPKQRVQRVQRNQTAPTREDIISLIETETVFDRSEHRLQVMEKISSYVRDVKRSQIIEIMHNELFDKVGFVQLSIEIFMNCIS